MNYPNHQGVTSLLFIIELDVPDSAKQHQEAHSKNDGYQHFLAAGQYLRNRIAVVKVGKSNLQCVVFDNSF